MSRLLTTDIAFIEARLNEYDERFIRQTGKSMAEIAKKAAGLTAVGGKRLKAAVIPVTSGLGIIEGYTQAVAAILGYCGAEVRIMEKTDVAGIQQAFLLKYELAFLADDDTCAAFGIGNTAHSDNGYATGRGYAVSLTEAMMKRGVDPSLQRVLIIGAGPVGTAAAEYIAQQNGVPVICDLDRRKSFSLAASLQNSEWLPAPAPVSAFPYIIDASTADGFITEKEVSDTTIVAAPGMPCGVTAEAGKRACVIHNPLELGIMTMFFDCTKQIEG